MDYCTYLSQEVKEHISNGNSLFKRSKDIVSLEGPHATTYVIYNRLLNSPLFLDKEGFDFIQKNETVLLSADEEESELSFKATLINSFIYLLDGMEESDFIVIGKEKLLDRLCSGLYTTLLDLRVSSACNFGCKHCIAATAQTNELMTFADSKIIVDKYYDFLLKTKENDDIVFDVHFGIAEPLLAFPVIEKTILYIEEAYPSAKKAFSINTNLSLLTETQALFFKKHNVHLHVSIDGLNETNDLIRIYKDGRGTFDDVNSKIELLSKIGYPIFDIGVTLTDKNYEPFKNQLDGFIAWCVSKGITEVACEFDLINTTSISTDEKVNFLLSLIDKMEKRGISFDGTWSIPYRNLANASYAECAYSFCRGASGVNMSVDKYGNVYICSCSSKVICSIFNIEEELKSNKQFYSFVNNNLIPRFPECGGCTIEGCCVGQCSVTREYHSVKDRKIEEQCDFYRRITHALLLREAGVIEKTTDEDYRSGY